MPTPGARRSDEPADGKRRKMSRRRLAMQEKKKRQQFQPDFHGLERRMMPSTFTVTDTSDSDSGSLRQAILNSNATLGSNTIDFDIGTGAQTISLLSPLPAITVPLLIDGTSQPGYAGAPLIDLDGNGSAGSGLTLASGCDGSSISSIVINGFGNDAASDAQISIASSSDLIENCYIGTTAAGTAASDDGLASGVIITGADNSIGGNTAGTGNLISGNQGAGIALTGTGATGNLIDGNQIGTDRTGTDAIPNSGGVMISSGSSGNTIGGTAAGAGNTIAYNSGNGVTVGTSTSDTSVDNSILANSIHDNGGLGIDLGNDGVTLNDSSGHAGPNLFQDFPVITSVDSSNGTTTVTGTMTEAASTTYRIEFFSNPTPGRHRATARARPSSPSRV